MYIISPFTGFIRDSCTDARRRCACVAALSPAVSPPCCIRRRWSCYPRKASNVPPDAFRLGFGEKQRRLQFRQEKLGKTEPGAICVCVRVCAMQYCRAARIISRKRYLLFASNVTRRWPETLNKQGTFNVLPIPFHLNHLRQLQTEVTEVR